MKPSSVLASAKGVGGAGSGLLAFKGEGTETSHSEQGCSTDV